MIKVMIIGRSNVGKSALFNRLLKKSISVVSDSLNTTRNNIVGYFSNDQLQFELYDTGGLTKNKNDYYNLIFEQIQNLTKDIDLVLFTVDFQVGVTMKDFQIGKFLHSLNKKVLLCINKFDSHQQEKYDFMKLGFSNLVYISAIHAINIDKIYDVLTEVYNVRKNKILNINEEINTFCFLGLPNVGKSLIFNCLLKSDRSIVSSLAKTTRNTIQEDFIYNDKKYKLVDTAGFVKLTKLKDLAEKLYIQQTIENVERADVIFLVLDINQPITALHMRIGSRIQKFAKPTILIANKSDLIEDPFQKQQFLNEIKRQFYFLPIYKTIIISALSGDNVHKIFKEIDFLIEQMNTQYNLNFLNLILRQIDWLMNAQKKFSKRFTFKFITQVPTKKLTFLVQVKDLENLQLNQKKQFYRHFVSSLNIQNLPVKLIYKLWKK